MFLLVAAKYNYTLNVALIMCANQEKFQNRLRLDPDSLKYGVNVDVQAHNKSYPANPVLAQKAIS